MPPSSGSAAERSCRPRICLQPDSATKKKAATAIPKSRPDVMSEADYYFWSPSGSLVPLRSPCVGPGVGAERAGVGRGGGSLRLPGPGGCVATAIAPGLPAAEDVSTGAASVEAVGGAAAKTGAASGGVLAMAGIAGACDARTVDAGAGSFLENMTTMMTSRNAPGIIT